MSIICELASAPDKELIRLLDDPSEVSEYLQSIPQDLRIDLDKAGNGIHFLLTGTEAEGNPPHCYLMCGGKEIGDEDLGYGPGRAINSKETRAFFLALEKINSDELRKRFDPNVMMDMCIYPEIWDRDPAEDDTLGYLIENYESLREFLAKAVKLNHGLIIYFS